MWEWLTALMLGALLSGCSASRPPVCPPGGDAGRAVPAVGTGGAIGIHGTRNDALNRKGINWTHGCISLLSRDIQELYDTVLVGTLVVIEH